MRSAKRLAGFLFAITFPFVVTFDEGVHEQHLGEAQGRILGANFYDIVVGKMTFPNVFWNGWACDYKRRISMASDVGAKRKKAVLDNERRALSGQLLFDLR